MASRTLEITAKFTGERFRFDNNDGTSVLVGEAWAAKASKEALEKAGLDPDAPLTIKGDADPGELEHNRTYRFFGGWRNYFNRRLQENQKQFHFRTFVPHIPTDPDGVTDYLAVNGRGKGIGPSKAARLVKHFGADDVLSVCRNDPEAVAEVAKISPYHANMFADTLRAQAATERTRLEVDKLLSGRGFPKSLSQRVIKEWGNKASEQIAEDPYSLMQFKGVGFALADKLWISLGKDPAAIDRQALCLWYGLASDANGHTWFDATVAVQRLQRTIGPKADYRAAIQRGKEYGQSDANHYGAIATIRTNQDRADEDGPITANGNFLWLAEGRFAAAERFTAWAVAKALEESKEHQITRYEDIECTRSVVLRHATCHRCGRQLTAPTVHVLNEQPFGPTCIGYVDPHGQHQVYELREWLEQNPEVFRWIEEQPKGVITLPEVLLWPEPSEIDGISEHQREQVTKGLTSRISLLGGSPGTGKTHTLAAVIKSLHKSGRVGLGEIAVGAPTGKAAVRMTEALAEHGVSLRARTWHSLLGLGAGSDDEGVGNCQFKHNAGNPWPYKVVIGDETSMPPIDIMAAIMRARAPNTHMLLVGDVNQLPPVGNGAPFRDMIDAGLPYAELREIQRNSGGIVEACAAIRDCKPWARDYLDGTQNLVITGDTTPASQLQKTLSLIHESGEAGFDPTWDVQVLTAVNQSSELSRVKLNEKLQDVLNPNPAVDGTPFRLADKVVCLKNGFYESVYEVEIDPSDVLANDQGEVYVANGELGEVESIEERSLRIQLDNPTRLIRLPLGKKKDGEKATMRNWDLGYALSVHKFQGSEQKIVITLLDTYAGARMVCDRAWIYTAISRAKQKCYLVGTAETAERFCRVQKMSTRKTMLAKRIKLAQLNEEVRGL